MSSFSFHAFEPHPPEIAFHYIHTYIHLYYTYDTAAKADEAAQKRRAKAALLAEEEAALGSGGKAKVPTLSQKKAAAGKKGSNNKNDLSLLENALVGAAEKKRRQQKVAELEAKQKAEQAAKDRAAAKEQEALSMDPLLQNTDKMLEGAVGRLGNVQAMEETMNSGTGLAGAMQSLSISVPGSEIKSQKALYMAFEEKMLPIVKQEYPGLRLSQYKEKVFALWKKSPENPQNQLILEG